MDEDVEVYKELENAIKTELLPKIFRKDLVDDLRRSLVSNHIQYGGATINNPVESSPINLRISEVCTLQISPALMKRGEFNWLDHQKVMTAGQQAEVEAKEAEVTLCFNTIIVQKPPQEETILKRAGQLRRWLNAIPNSTLGCCLNM